MMTIINMPTEYLEGDNVVNRDKLTLVLNVDVSTKHEQSVRTDH